MNVDIQLDYQDDKQSEVLHILETSHVRLMHDKYRMQYLKDQIAKCFSKPVGLFFLLD